MSDDPNDNNQIFQLKHPLTPKTVSQREYQAVCKERDELKRMAVALIIKEREEYRKTITLQGEEVERLKGEQANYRTLNSLLGDNGEICELHDDIEALQAKLDKAIEALEKIATFDDPILLEDAIIMRAEAQLALKLIKGDGE